MLWITAAPFFRSTSPEWIPKYVASPDHRFSYVPAGYEHDRSRASTSAGQWLDYLLHALRAWFSVAPWRRDVGLICCFPQLPVMLGLIKRLTGSKRPLVAWMFNLGQTYGGFKGRLARFGLRSVDCFVVHSSAEIESYSRWLQLPRERFVFVPLSIQTAAASQEADEREPYVFAMGTANRDYGLLFQAVEALGYRTIVVAGEHAVSGLPRPSNVSVLSQLTLKECHRLCQQARVNVIPVDNVVTASGQVTLLETMMYGKAVVATRCVGTVDYVDDGRTAVLVEPRNLSALRTAIEQLWLNAAARARMGEAARLYIEKHVSFPGVAADMQRILDRVAREAA